MKDLLLKLYIKAQALREEHGQDMVEYALVVGIIALGCHRGYGGLWPTRLMTCGMRWPQKCYGPDANRVHVFPGSGLVAHGPTQSKLCNP